ESVTLEQGEASVPLQSTGELFEGVVDVQEGGVALVARATTARGRKAEASVLVNARGFVTTSDAHAIDQMVSVTHNGSAVEGLSAADFKVKDDHGMCEVRDVKLVKDTPLALGFAVDISISLAHNRELLKETAQSFLDQCFKERDSGFLLSFGPVVSSS